MRGGGDSGSAATDVGDVLDGFCPTGDLDRIPLMFLKLRRQQSMS